MNFQEAMDKGLIREDNQLWICDYRFNDVTEKPIRHIRPQQVQVVHNCQLPKNKNVYYSNHHFRPLGKNGQPKAQVIAPYDNTGYRFYSGEAVKVFETKEECVAFYQDQCAAIVKDIEREAQRMKTRLDLLKAEVQAESLSASSV